MPSSFTAAPSELVRIERVLATTPREWNPNLIAPLLQRATQQPTMHRYERQQLAVRLDKLARRYRVEAARARRAAEECTTWAQQVRSGEAPVDGTLDESS